MIEHGQTLSKQIDLDDGLRLVYLKPADYIRYYSIYYGQKYANYYFRRSSMAVMETITIFDCGYLIMKDEKSIGGVFLKLHFMADLFVIPPYDDYEGLVQKLLNYLKKVSMTGEKIIIREVVEECVPTYLHNGCQVQEVNYWMIRPTQSINTVLPDGYIAKPVLPEYTNEIALLIMKAYKANPVMKDIAAKEFYIQHVKHFLEEHRENEIMDECSRIVIDEKSNNIVGVCLHMEFEDYPLIMSMAVDPEHQRKGLGRFLLTHSINISSKAYPATRLAVLKGNPSIKLYENLGFIRNNSLTEMYI